MIVKNKKMKATHTGVLHIGNIEIPCHVLENGDRVLSGRGMQNSLGFSRSSSGVALPNLVESKLKDFLSDEVINKLKNPVAFERIGRGGSAPETHGNDATILVDLCDALIEARKQGKLTKAQNIYAEQAEMIIRSIAKVGIIALIDEATGYQEVRDKQALAAILDKFLRKELAAWAKRFPDEFYKEMFRLRGWEWSPSSVAKPSVVGKYTNDLVYERIAPALLEELERKNPKNKSGNRSNRHHQWLTDEVGHPALSQHLHAVIGLMRASGSWEGFYRLMQKSFPKRGDTLELPLDE